MITPRTSPLLRCLALCACALSWACCGSPPASGQDPQVGAVAGHDDAWEEAMEQIDDDVEAIEAELGKGSAADLKSAAAAARRAAALVAMGYGEHEHKDVKDFGRMALACESWLLDLANEAERGHFELARERFKLASKHCFDCHDACDARSPW
jgi:hypothetical protein